MIYVVGHKNPDTDSFCAAVACAAFLQHDSCGEVTPIVLGDANGETAYVFDKLGLPFPEKVTSLPAGSDVVLVDHNEASQSVDGRDALNIIAVYDHHKVADFSTSGPLKMCLEPVGCTCTILYEEFIRKEFIPTKEVAGLMCAAIISDTLLYKSPTTTQRDRDALEGLSVIAEIGDLEAFAMGMFNAKSDLSALSAEEVVTMDYKTFDFHGKTMGIGVLETTNSLFALDRKEEILLAMDLIKKRDGLDYILLCVVDILEEKNTALVLGKDEEELLGGAFAANTENNCADLGARMSRKKQLVPKIDEYIATM